MLRTGAVFAAGLDRTENAFPLFLETWRTLIESALGQRDDSRRG